MLLGDHELLQGVGRGAQCGHPNQTIAPAVADEAKKQPKASEEEKDGVNLNIRQFKKMNRDVNSLILSGAMAFASQCVATDEFRAWGLNGHELRYLK